MFFMYTPLFTVGSTPKSKDAAPTRWEGQIGAPGMLAWLLDSYERTLVEDRHTAAKKSCGKQRREVLAMCRECIVSHVALLLSEVELFDPTYTPITDTLPARYVRGKQVTKQVSSR